jgi:hypothetical protein
LSIGSNGISSDVTIGKSHFGLKATRVTSGSGITLSGSKVIYRKDLTFNAKNSVSISNGCSVEANISGKYASFSATADSDQTDGGGFTLDSTSLITTQGGKVTLIGNTVTNNGTVTTNGGTLTSIERSSSSSSSSSSSGGGITIAGGSTNIAVTSLSASTFDQVVTIQQSQKWSIC